MAEPVNVVCMKWGTLYSAHYVNVLRAMVKRHLSRSHRFVCFTDDPTGIEQDIETFPLPDVFVPKAHAISPWRKLGMFSDPLGDLKGKTLFLDLDVAIVDDLDPFFTYSDHFAIIENWTQLGRGIGNSSVYCFNIGAHKNVLETYQNNTQTVLETHDNEQIFLSKTIADITFWPAPWCQSYKHHCIPSGLGKYIQEPKLPKDCKIVVFHGLPNPPEAIKGGFFGSLRKYARPAPWLKEHWSI